MKIQRGRWLDSSGGTTHRAAVHGRAVRWLAIVAVMACSRAEPGVGKVVPDFATLARQAMTTLPAPPGWDEKQQVSPWTIDELKAELAKITHNPPRINSLRTTLLRPEHAWFTDLDSWFRKIQKPLNIHFIDEVWDCDDYASCFVAFADVIALKAGEKRGSFCIGWATVFYQQPFARIRAGTAHAVVIVGTSKGLFVLEPQDGTLVALAKFPNRHSIVEIFF